MRHPHTAILQDLASRPTLIQLHPRFNNDGRALSTTGGHEHSVGATDTLTCGLQVHSSLPLSRHHP